MYCLTCTIATEQFTVDKNLKEMPLRSQITTFIRMVLNMKWADDVSEVAHSPPTHVLQRKAEVTNTTNENLFFIIFLWSGLLSCLCLIFQPYHCSRAYTVIFWEKITWKLSTFPLTQTEYKQYHDRVKLEKKPQNGIVVTEIRYHKSTMPDNLLHFRESSPGN